MTTKRQTVGVGFGVIGAGLLWAYTNLGVMFFALLALLFLNLLAAIWEKDPLQEARKWFRIIVGAAVPALVPTFANVSQVTWTMADTRWIIAAMFAALFAATYPELLATFEKVWTKLFGNSAASKATENEVIADLQAEIARLKAQAPVQPSNIGFTPAVASNLVNPPKDGGSGGQ